MTGGQFVNQAEKLRETTVNSSFRIPSLDGIRAVSILLVFSQHAGFEVAPGGFGVTIFFFLSGFLITTLLRREFETHGRVHYREFYWRRIWRIFPPMYAALAFGVVASLVGLTEHRVTVLGVAAQAGHLTNYGTLTGLQRGMAPGTEVLWSLAVEEHFYLLFPVCAAFLMRRFPPKRQAATLLAVCVAIMCWRIVLIVGLDAELNRTYLATDTRLDSILFGCVMGLYRNPSLDPVRQLTSRAALLITAAATTTIVGTLVIRDEVFRETVRYTIQSLALAPLFYVSIQRADLWPFRVLNHRSIAFVGVLSYSLYLVHFVVIYAVQKQLPSVGVPTVAAVAGIVSLVLAYGFHRFIEQPATKMRRRYTVPWSASSLSDGAV